MTARTDWTEECKKNRWHLKVTALRISFHANHSVKTKVIAMWLQYLCSGHSGWCCRPHSAVICLSQCGHRKGGTRGCKGTKKLYLTEHIHYCFQHTLTQTCIVLYTLIRPSFPALMQAQWTHAVDQHGFTVPLPPQFNQVTKQHFLKTELQLLVNPCKNN